MSSADVLELEAAPPILSDDTPYEIVDGQRVEPPPMGANESILAFELASAINQYAKPRGLGRASTEVLVRLSSQPNLQRRPDAVFVSVARWPTTRKIPRGNAWDVVPDLIVEVVSPTNLAEEIPTRVRDYFHSGVRRAWIIYVHESLVYEYDSPRSIRVLGREDILDGGEVIPGFRLPLSELLEGPEEPEPA
jgi:Uma2 family endonuclease